MKSIETLLNINLGKQFATPKKLNRSTRLIPENVLESLESREFTFEMIEELKTKFPIFHYKSCLTIHGYWGEVTTKRIGYYKNIHQNKNGSLEVYYSAIDVDKIKNIRNNLFSVNCKKWYYLDNSTDRVFRYSKPITPETAIALREEFLNETNRIKALAIYGTIHCYISPKLWGGADIVIDIRPLAIPEKEVLNVSYMLTGIVPENWHQTQLNVERERTIQQEIDDKERAKRDAIKQAHYQALDNRMKAEYLPQIEHLQPGTVHQGPIVKIKSTYKWNPETETSNDTFIFEYFKIDGKGSFGNTKWSTATSDQFTPEINTLTWTPCKQAKTAEIKKSGRLIK